MSTPLQGSFPDQLRSRLGLYALNSTTQDDSHNSIFTLVTPGIVLDSNNFTKGDDELRTRLESNLFNQFIPWSDYSYQDGTLISDRYLQAVDSVVIKPDEGLRNFVQDLTKAAKEHDIDDNSPNREVVQSILTSHEISVSKDVRSKVQYSTVRNNEKSPKSPKSGSFFGKNGKNSQNSQKNEKDQENEEIYQIAHGDEGWYESLTPDLTLPIIPYDIDTISANINEYLSGLKILIEKLKNILSRFSIIGFSFEYSIEDIQNSLVDFHDMYEVYLSYVRDKNNVLNQNEFIFGIGNGMESFVMDQFEQNNNNNNNNNSNNNNNPDKKNNKKIKPKKLTKFEQVTNALISLHNELLNDSKALHEKRVQFDTAKEELPSSDMDFADRVSLLLNSIIVSSFSIFSEMEKCRQIFILKKQIENNNSNFADSLPNILPGGWRKFAHIMKDPPNNVKSIGKNNDNVSGGCCSGGKSKPTLQSNIQAKNERKNERKNQEKNNENNQDAHVFTGPVDDVIIVGYYRYIPITRPWLNTDLFLNENLRRICAQQITSNGIMDPEEFSNFEKEKKVQHKKQNRNNNNTDFEFTPNVRTSNGLVNPGIFPNYTIAGFAVKNVYIYSTKNCLIGKPIDDCSQVDKKMQKISNLFQHNTAQNIKISTINTALTKKLFLQTRIFSIEQPQIMGYINQLAPPIDIKELSPAEKAEIIEGLKKTPETIEEEGYEAEFDNNNDDDGESDSDDDDDIVIQERYQQVEKK